MRKRSPDRTPADMPARRSRRMRIGSVALGAVAALALPALVAPAASAAPASAAVSGSFNSEIGCSSDWNTQCAAAQLTARADGQWARTIRVPAGNYEYKVTIDGSWDENYGANGERGGSNIPLSVPSGGAEIAFVYDPNSHRVSTTLGGGNTPPNTGETGGTLGALYSSGSTTFRIWSPDSSDVSVDVGGRNYPMTRTEVPGYTDVYQAVASGNLKGESYQFKVRGNSVRDPYAQMVEPGTTKGVVLDSGAIAPTGGSWAATPRLVNREDAVIYEMSIRDFTIDASSGVSADKRGKFLGAVQTGTTNNGVKTGIDHLKELGVTHVQLMPSYDFNSTVPNWGYDPLNYNVPEEQFSVSRSPEARVREFKDMVNEFHKAGIRVVLDVVYNHTANKDVFSGITDKYYTDSDLSGTGNAIDDGNPMVASMIKDSLEHWVRDYNLDGFRFDLLGVHRYDNAADWGSHLNKEYPDRNLLIYGEPWNGGAGDPLESSKVRYGSVPALADAHMGVFNGAYRDAIKGGTRDKELNYMAGFGTPADVARGTAGSLVQSNSKSVLSNPWSPSFAYDPEQTINYVSAHDDLSLWDKITFSGLGGGQNGVAGKVDRFATGMVLTSQGIPFITEGDEFLRTKVVNGDYETASNSYEAGDNVNAIHWGDKAKNAATFKYYRDAIALRKSTPALRLTTGDAVRSQQNTELKGSVVISKISSGGGNADTVVVYNQGDDPYGVDLPTGNWTKVLDSGGAASGSGNQAAGKTVTVFKRN